MYGPMRVSLTAVLVDGRVGLNLNGMRVAEVPATRVPDAGPGDYFNVINETLEGLIARVLYTIGERQ